jgi:hypothetical protein
MNTVILSLVLVVATLAKGEPYQHDISQRFAKTEHIESLYLSNPSRSLIRSTSKTKRAISSKDEERPRVIVPKTSGHSDQILPKAPLLKFERAGKFKVTVAQPNNSVYVLFSKRPSGESSSWEEIKILDFKPDKKDFEINATDFANPKEALLTVWAYSGPLNKGSSIPVPLVYKSGTASQKQYSFEFESTEANQTVTVVFALAK